VRSAIIILIQAYSLVGLTSSCFLEQIAVRAVKQSCLLFYIITIFNLNSAAFFHNEHFSRLFYFCPEKLEPRKLRRKKPFSHIEDIIDLEVNKKEEKGEGDREEKEGREEEEGEEEEGENIRDVVSENKLKKD
jgi:hypothetical protein